MVTCFEEDRLIKGAVIPGESKKKVCRYALHPSPENLMTVREFISTSLKPFQILEPHVHDIIFATHEACKNAVEHNPESKEPVDVVCEVFEDSVVVEVTDKGKGFDPSTIMRRVPDPDAPDGRGMLIIYSLMDAVETRTGENGTSVRMQKRINPDSSVL